MHTRPRGAGPGGRRPPRRMSTARSEHRITVRAPFRLDLTVSVLRRLSTNIVDLFTDDLEYLRAFGGARGPVIARVKQVRGDELVHEADAAGGDDVFARLLLELPDVIPHRALQYGRVLPLRILQGAGHDVLRDRVEVVGDAGLVVGLLRPEAPHVLERPAPDQEGDE